MSVSRSKEIHRTLVWQFQTLQWQRNGIVSSTYANLLFIHVKNDGEMWNVEFCFFGFFGFF